MFGGNVDVDNFNQGPDRGSPGWQRLQKNKAKPLQGRASPLKTEEHNFKLGERCFHQKFGPGTVVSVDGDHLSIEFDKAGHKKVVAAFVEKPS